MTTIRRWYIFLVCAISLQSVTWAMIALLRNLFTTGGNIPTLRVAFSLSVMIIGFPLFLAHWLWEQRLAGRDPEERGSTLRSLYLYGMMAGFLLPFVFNIEIVLRNMVNTLLQYPPLNYQPAYPLQSARALLALFILGPLWLYHYLQARADDHLLTLPAITILVRRLYVLILSGIGLLAVTISSTNLLFWLLMHLGPDQLTGDASFRMVVADTTWLIVGIPLWIIHWAWAQRLFYGISADEKASSARKFYLYAVVFVGVIGLVSNLTILLAGFLRRVLGLASQGDWREVLPWVCMFGVLWAYHDVQLRRDARKTAELPQQAAIRRLYHYLVAAIGLTAFLIGLGGDISILIRAVGGEPAGLLKEQLAWFTAALVAGLPVWLFPWRSQQTAIFQESESGLDESRSLVRRTYLYLFIFAGTITMLGCAIVIVYRLLSTLMGEEAVTATELTQAIAYVLIALGVWLYHGQAIRRDGRHLQQAKAQRLSTLLVLVWDDANGWAEQITTLARSEIKGAAIEVAASDPGLPERIASAGVLVFPWTIYQPENGISPEILQAIAASPARKLLLPACPNGWDWAGVEKWDGQVAARQAVRALKQILEGEPVRVGRSLGAGSIAALTIGALILLIVVWVIGVSLLQAFLLPY